MQEKRYLIIKQNGVELGAFEGLESIEENEGVLKFTSEEGSFEYVKGEDGIYRSEDNDIEFDEYDVKGRRAINRRLGGSVKDVRHADDWALDNDEE